MKKEYKKPQITIESFALTQSIAKNCGTPVSGYDNYRPTLQDVDVCGFYSDESDFGDEAVTYWISQGICTEIVDLDYDLGIGCYNGPTGGVGIFGSV